MKVFIYLFSVLFLAGVVSATTLYDGACSTFTHERIHDLGQEITGTNTVTAMFLPGWSSNCWTTGSVYVSENNNGPWVLLGETDSTHQPVSTTKDFSYTGSFRYVKIFDTNGACYNDCSSASVILNNNVPEFGLIAGIVALIGALAVFVYMKR